MQYEPGPGFSWYLLLRRTLVLYIFIELIQNHRVTPQLIVLCLSAQIILLLTDNKLHLHEQRINQAGSCVGCQSWT